MLQRAQANWMLATTAQSTYTHIPHNPCTHTQHQLSEDISKTW